MTQNPFTPFFDAQRTAVEQSQKLTHEALDAQKTSFGASVTALEAMESLLEQNAELTNGAVHAYVDALEANMPAEAAEFDELRTFVDEQFDAATETQGQSFEALYDAIEESESAYDEFADNYSEVVDSSFDAFLEGHEQVVEVSDEMAATVDEAAEEIDISA